MPITAEARTRQNQYFFSTLLVMLRRARQGMVVCSYSALSDVAIGWPMLLKRAVRYRAWICGHPEFLLSQSFDHERNV
jgi:hypothetical protein